MDPTDVKRTIRILNFTKLVRSSLPGVGEILLKQLEYSFQYYSNDKFVHVDTKKHITEIINMLHNSREALLNESGTLQDYIDFLQLIINFTYPDMRAILDNIFP